MPNPKHYSANMIAKIFSEANTYWFPSEEFKQMRDAFKSLQHLQKEYDEAKKKDRPMPLEKEIGMLKNIEKASNVLKAKADFYTQRKEEKPKEKRSLEEEARLSAGKALSVFADDCTKEYAEIRERIENLQKCEAAVSEINDSGVLRNANGNRKRAFISYILIEEKLEKKDNITVSRVKKGVNGIQTTLTDRNTGKSAVYANGGFDKASYTVSSQMKELLKDNGITYEFQKDDYLNFARESDGIKRITDLLNNGNNDRETRRTAEKMLSAEDKLKAYVKWNVDLYNFKVKALDYDGHSEHQIIDMPDDKSTKDFFTELAEKTKGNPDRNAEEVYDLAKGVVNLREALGKSKEITAAETGEKNADKPLMSRKAVKEAQDKLDRRIIELKYQEMLNDAAVKKVKLNITDDITGEVVSAVKYTRKTDNGEKSVLVEDEDAGKVFNADLTEFITDYKPDAGKFKEAADLYDAQNLLPSITGNAEKSINLLLKNVDDSKRIKDTGDFIGSDKFRGYLERTVRYINTVNRYNGSGSRQIEYPANLTGKEYFDALRKSARGVSGAEKLAEACGTLSKLSGLVSKLAIRDQRNSEYDDLAKRLEETDVYIFPSGQYKQMKAQFKKLRYTKNLPNDEERKRAFQDVYNAACDYILHKDPDARGKKLSKQPPVEDRQRLHFANWLKTYCENNGAVLDLYENKQKYVNFENAKKAEAGAVKIS